ncbi:MAG: TolC family protein [Terracidiphilus sp.]
MSCIFSASASAQGSLTLRQAIQRALDGSPEAEMARAETRDAAGNASLARTQLLPQLNFTEDISRGDDPVYVFGSRLRQQAFSQADFALNSLNRPQPIGDFVSRFSGSWMAFDSFRTQKTIHSADLMRKSANSSAQAINQKIVLDVVEAYQSVLYAERQVAIAQHEQETAEALLSSVSEHVKAELAVDSDRMSAEVNVAARKEELIAAQGELEIAWAQLRMAMGERDLKKTQLDPITARDFPQTALDEELQTAFETRSDFAAIGEAQSAQSEAVGAARDNFGPRISAYGNWEQDRPSFAGAGGENWVAGVQINIDIAPFSKRSQLEHERAARDRVNAEVASYQQQVQFQVTRAHVQRETAQLSLETARAAIDQAAERLRILKNRYEAGLATITDLLRAEDAEREAQMNYWHAVYGNTMAYAQLLFATGTLTPDAAEKLQ